MFLLLQQDYEDDEPQTSSDNRFQHSDKDSEGSSYSKVAALKSEAKQEATVIPPFFDEVLGKNRTHVSPVGYLSADSAKNRLNMPTNSPTHSLSSLSSPLSQSLGDHTSATDLSRGVSSTSNLNINIPGNYSDSDHSYHARKPTISGIHSTHSLHDVPRPKRPVDLNLQAMRNSHSEPYLQSPMSRPQMEDRDDGDIFE